MANACTSCVVLCAAALLLGPRSAAAAQWVTFDASPVAAGVDAGEHASGHGASPVRGLLSIPLEAGRRPALVLLPSCEGRRAFHDGWALALAEHGYVALLVDDYFMLDRGRSCGLRDPAARADAFARRVQNARAAMHYLVSRAEVDRARMAVMGWGDAPADALMGASDDAAPSTDRFAAGIAMFPTRCIEASRVSGPLLVLRAASGAAEAGEQCAAPAAAGALEIRTYPETAPGFDNPRAVADGASQRSRYDRLAHGRAIEDVMAFLRRGLASQPARGAQRAEPLPGAAGFWAVDPDEPGPDLPPAGGSAFDAVFSRTTANGVVYDIPYPFSKLLQRLEWAAGAQRMARSPLDTTLIPLGRSLQREAAAPDYFRSPRIVVAVTGEPDSGSGPLGVRLMNRLFLGYQPRSDSVEIISYNDAAARFEFQVVHGYGSGRAPAAVYARRALCVSCHQNAAPIFPDASWGETTADAQVARQLQALGQRFHGVPVAPGDRAVVAIDIATDEANLLPVYQRLWSQGCMSRDAREIGACRAGALLAMVQYRLSGAAGFDRAAPLYAGGYVPVQRRNWRDRWPRGLLIPDSNLPDRVPLMSHAPSQVPATLDPLRARPALARWDASSVRDLERLVRGLSRELPQQHLAVLDRQLRDADDGASSRVLSAPCAIVRRGFAGRPRLYQIECAAAHEQRDGFRLQAQLHVNPDGIAHGRAALEIGGGNYGQIVVSGRLTQASRMALRISETAGAAPVRAPDGNAIEPLVLSWDQGVAESATRLDATGTLGVRDDFRPLAAAIARLAARTEPGSPLRAERFDAERLSAALLRELGVLPDAPCCPVRRLPAPRLAAASPGADAVLALALEHRGPLQTLNHYCGACHGGDTDHPPGFLHGDAETVFDAVTRCAERIYYRLSMWQFDANEQAVTPMPPTNGLGLVHTTAGEWRRSESLQRLTAYARTLIASAGRDPGAVLAARYQATQPCLAGTR